MLHFLISIGVTMARLIFICMVLILLSLFSVTFIVPEIVNSFGSVSEIIFSVAHHIQVFTVLSILVLIFLLTSQRSREHSFWPALLIALDSRKMSSEMLSL